MKYLTTVLLTWTMLLLYNVANAAPELRQKPVQCGLYEEVYQAYILPNKLKPMFTGVGTIQTQTGSKMAIGTVFYLNHEDGRWLYVETDQDETCVIGLGDGFNPNIDPDELNKMLLNKSGEST